MTIDTKSITQHVMFWLLIAFIAGFGFSEILTRANINPFRADARLAGPDTVYCGPGGNAEAMGYVCGNPYESTKRTQTDVNIQDDTWTDVRFLDCKPGEIC